MDEVVVMLYILLEADEGVSLYVEEIPLSLHLKDPEDVIVARGQEATLKCEAQSSAPGLSISWFHEGSLILPNDNHTELLSDGSLYIPKMEGKKLEGKYRCLAKNNNGAVLSSPAMLKFASIGREFIEEPRNISVAAQQPTVLPCTINSFPNATVYWERDSKPLPHNSRYVPLPLGALLITSTHSSDSGVYRCVASNSILKKTKRSKPGQLIVLPPITTIEPPKFLSLGLATNLSAFVLNNITLPCAVTGWPLPTVQWLNDQGILVNNSTVLELHHVTPNSTGIYTCIATNSAGLVKMNYTVQIQEAPYFIATPVSISYPSARLIRLVCQAKGIPQPTIHWLKNGIILEPMARIKQQQNGILISHSFTTDAGFYQCVASNSAGQKWVSAQLMPIFSENRPNPPQNVNCRPFDDSSICLVWCSPPNISIQAYSIYVFNEIKDYDFVTNYTHYLTSGLQKNTRYTFYVRSYSKQASDQSNNVTCKTGIEGERNLTVTSLSGTSVKLTWSNISTDIPCGSTTPLYKVQWKTLQQSSVHIEHTSNFKKIISRLQPSAVYQFRVQSTTNKHDDSTWVTFKLSTAKKKPEDTIIQLSTNETENSENQTLIALSIPTQLEVESTSPHSVNLTWISVSEEDDVSYKVYCTDVVEGKSRIIDSKKNYLAVLNLKPNTLYEFKVQSINGKGDLSTFSHSVQVQTLNDVPSSVRNLKYRVINVTAVCVMWKAPIITNGKLLNYVISYTSDKNLQFDKWKNVVLTEKNMLKLNCWPLEKDDLSIVLTELSSNLHYTLIVRAVNTAGYSNPTIPLSFLTVSKTTNTNYSDQSIPPENQDAVTYNQKLGVVLGVSICVICIFCCVSCILFRRRCVKRQTLRRTRLTTANHCYPSGVPYADGSLQIHYQESCTGEAHEMQHLVLDDILPHIPPITSTYLDTKGGVDFPNGPINGSIQHAQVNDHVPNGHIHITENPRYQYQNCNGNFTGKKTNKDCSPASLKNLKKNNSIHNLNNSYGNLDITPSYKLDSPVYTSNTSYTNTHIEDTTSDILSLKLFDVSDYNSNCNLEIDEMYNTNQKGNYSDLELDTENGLNHTHVTYLDDSFSPLPNRVILPALAPNG
ncbi:hypothetical protein FQA39_LY00369 [Lamprigera yunnana]|nr:hypothetical protein FQA39_LY00369 [Lamprigera yunnana]